MGIFNVIIHPNGVSNVDTTLETITYKYKKGVTYAAPC